MGRATDSMTHEQQELLDSGLRVLAHMIAETHLRRVVLRKEEYMAHLPEITRSAEREMPGKCCDKNISEVGDE